MDLEMRPTCGLGSCQPRGLRKFVTINWFSAIYSVTGLLTASLGVYMVSQITTIERQFGLSSTKSGYLMACNDIGYSALILVGSYFAHKVHIPRFLACSSMLYGVSGILCSIPHFLFKPVSLTAVGSDAQSPMTFSGPPPNLCYNSSVLNHLRTTTPYNFNNVTNTETSGDGSTDATKSAVAMAFIATGMAIQGVGKAPRYPMLGQFVDDNTSPRETGFYMGKT